MNELVVENIKCDGCATTISKKLYAINGVDKVEINVENGIVKIQSQDWVLDEVRETLAKIGYPEVGSEAGVKSVVSKVKSFISCASGKIDK